MTMTKTKTNTKTNTNTNLLPTCLWRRPHSFTTLYKQSTPLSSLKASAYLALEEATLFLVDMLTVTKKHTNTKTKTKAIFCLPVFGGDRTLSPLFPVLLSFVQSLIQEPCCSPQGPITFSSILIFAKINQWWFSSLINILYLSL